MAPGSSGVTIQLGWVSVTRPSAASHSKLTLMVRPRSESLRSSNCAWAKPAGVLDLRAARRASLPAMRWSLICVSKVPSALVVT